MGDDFLTAKIEGSREVLAGLARLNPGQNRKIAGRALTESMLLALRNSATRAIFPGGKGPPKADMLTSRTGTLRRSLASSFALDRSGLPRYIEGGTNLVYGAVHEYGGTTPLGNTGQMMPRRPFLEPGLRMSEDQFPAIFAKWWAREGGVS